MPSLTEAQTRIVARLRAGEELRKGIMWYFDAGGFFWDRTINGLVSKGLIRIVRTGSEKERAVLVGEPEEREGQ